jgi:hypothetical protein
MYKNVGEFNIQRSKHFRGGILTLVTNILKRGDPMPRSSISARGLAVSCRIDWTMRRAESWLLGWTGRPVLDFSGC